MTAREHARRATDKHPCHYCGQPCYRICYIGSKLACIECFDRLAVQPASKVTKWGAA